MSNKEVMLEVPPPTPDTSVPPEATEAEVLNQRRWPLKLATLSLSGLMALGLVGNDGLTNYAQLATANLDHVWGQKPDPRSFDYLEEYEVSNGLFTDNITGNYTQIWPHSQALSALHILSLIPGNEAKYNDRFRLSLKAASNYWDKGSDDALPGYNATVNSTNFGTPERFVDDNLWMGLIHMQEYEATGDPAQLQMSQQIFDLAYRQWDAQGGGIFWQVQWPGVENSSRAMVSNAPAIQLGGALYLHTGNKELLPKVEEIFKWMLKRKDEAVGVFNDHIGADGKHDLSKYTYVQGVAAGAMAEMSQIMPEKYSLLDAVDFASLSLKQLKQAKLMHNPAFDAIFFRNLLKISSLYKHPDFTQKVQGGLRETVDKLPYYPNDLLEFTGMMQLRAMQQVPESEYSKLF